MTLQDLGIFNQRVALPDHTARLRLSASCSVVALTLMLAATGPAAAQVFDEDQIAEPVPQGSAAPLALCPSPIGGTITVNTEQTCNVNFGGYAGSSINLLVTATGSLAPPSLATIYNSGSSPVGNITILGQVQTAASANRLSWSPTLVPSEKSPWVLTPRSPSRMAQPLFTCGLRF